MEILSIGVQVEKQCLYLQASRGQLADMGADKRWVTPAQNLARENASALVFDHALAYL